MDNLVAHIYCFGYFFFLNSQQWITQTVHCILPYASGKIGALCADTLKANEDDFAPFCEYTDDVTNFDQYVNVVRDTAEWGGHLELRALGMALDRPIHIYSVQSGKDPLTIHDDDTARGASDGNKDPILLSYHLHYYALGEHYNQVVIIKKET